MSLNGIRIIESVWLEEDGMPYQQTRSWRERLFSRPWRPWKATHTVIPRVPMRGGVMLNSQTMVMHPQTLKALMLEMKKSPLLPPSTGQEPSE